MNMHGIVGGLVVAVNPWITAGLYASNSSTTDESGERTPKYTARQNVQVQSQALTYSDLQQLDGVQLQGVRRGVYLAGRWDGIIRADQKGGDLLVFPDRPGGPDRVWKAALVLEYWPDWVKLAVTLQVMDPASIVVG